MEDYLEWRASLKPKQRKRLYKHFDKVLDLDIVPDFNFVTNVLNNIKNHQFLPLVKFIKKEIRFKRGKSKQRVRSAKERPIMYASHLDAFIYSFYAHQWGKAYETFLQKEGIEDNVIAYRKKSHQKVKKPGKNNIYFAYEVFGYIQSLGNCTVVIADISKFFDKLNHKYLKQSLCQILETERLSDDEYKTLKSLMQFRFILNDSTKKKTHSSYAKFLNKVLKESKKKSSSLPEAIYELGRNGLIVENRTTWGIPQGSPLSGLLANIYMAKFDSKLVKKFPRILYRRYSDDVAIICETKDTQEVLEFLSEEIKVSHLDINPSKMTVSKFEKQSDGSVQCTEVKKGNGEILGKKFIDYLGFEFNGIVVRIRAKTLQNSYRKAHLKIKKFHNRQGDKNPRKKHSEKSFSLKPIRKGSYLKNAEKMMNIFGKGVSTQQSNLNKFIQRKMGTYKTP